MSDSSDRAYQDGASGSIFTGSRANEYASYMTGKATLGRGGSGVPMPPGASRVVGMRKIADTRLFETTNFSVVWSASTTTSRSGGIVPSLFDQFSQLIVGALAKGGLV